MRCLRINPNFNFQIKSNFYNVKNLKKYKIFYLINNVKNNLKKLRLMIIN